VSICIAMAKVVDYGILLMQFKDFDECLSVKISVLDNSPSITK